MEMKKNFKRGKKKKKKDLQCLLLLTVLSTFVRKASALSQKKKSAPSTCFSVVFHLLVRCRRVKTFFYFQ